MFVCMPHLNALRADHFRQKFSDFDSPSHSTEAIAKIERTTVQLDKSGSKNSVQGLDT